MSDSFAPFSTGSILREKANSSLYEQILFGRALPSRDANTRSKKLFLLITRPVTGPGELKMVKRQTW